MMRSSPIKWVSQFHGYHLPHSINPTNFLIRPSVFDWNGIESPLIKWVSCFPLNNQVWPSKIPFLGGFRRFATVVRSKRLLRDTKVALCDYLHGTRGLPFTDAEYISHNSPFFLMKLLEKVERVEKGEVSDHALKLLFRYHPINEFEPFFESLGLKPSEFEPLIPRDLMFISDDKELLENYRVLCDYGIARNKIGRIYKDATEIFRYEMGVLDLKLQAYEELGLSKTDIVSIVTSAPALLIGEVNREFVKVLEALEAIGVERSWIASVMSERNLYDWGRMLIIMQMFIEMGFTKKESGNVIRSHPGFLLDRSGKSVFSLVTLLLKLGRTRSEMVGWFSRFPTTQVGCFQRNLFQGLAFLMEIEMDPEDIQNLLLTRTEVFGLCSLKSTTSIKVGKQRLCKIIKENPLQLQMCVLGVKADFYLNDREKQRAEKKRFLLRLGFAKGSPEMKSALKQARGKGDQLQDRFDFLVKTGLERNDVSRMIKRDPQILNSTIEILKSKIDFLVNSTGFPLRSLVSYPSYLTRSVGRAKLRFSMYNWLKDRRVLCQELSLYTIIHLPDNEFIERYVNRHPDGLDVWEKYKKCLSST